MNSDWLKYADRLIMEAHDAIQAETGLSAPILAGHSLGGTLAAIFATLHPGHVGRLLLVDAPLAFGEHGGPLARAVRALPHAGMIRRASGSPVPGSVINTLCVAAAPEIFHLQERDGSLSGQKLRVSSRFGAAEKKKPNRHRAETAAKNRLIVAAAVGRPVRIRGIVRGFCRHAETCRRISGSTF